MNQSKRFGISVNVFHIAARCQTWRCLGRGEDYIIMHLRQASLDGLRLMWPALDVRLLGFCDCVIEI